MINVLWVDDLAFTAEGLQSDICKSIVNSAYDEGIDIIPYATYAEAYKELEDSPSKWTAIILDVNNSKATEGNENQDYLSMREKIIEFRKSNNNSVEPYIFVLSADQGTIADAKKYFRKDSELQTKEVYVKPTDGATLFEDIKTVARYSENYSIYKEHESLMDSLVEMNWTPKEQEIVFALIKSIEKRNDYKNDSIFNGMRKLLESTLYRTLEIKGVMDGLHGFLMTQKNQDDTLNNRSNYIGKNKSVPVYIQRAFHSLTVNVQNGSHKDDKKETNIIVANDVSEGKAPYLLKSCLYDLLTIIAWEASL